MPRVDGDEKVRGRTLFTTDIQVDRMLHAYPVYSAVSSGRIRRIVIDTARAAEGFVDAVFAEDIPGENLVDLILPDQQLFVDTRVRYIGDTIGLVIAETEEAAFRIAGMVDVDYKETPACLTIEASRSATGNFIHESNVACTHRVIKGDVERGFSQSDRIIEATFKTPFQEHFYLEPQACIAVPDDDGGITVQGSMQCVFYVRKAVAKVLGLPFSKVRVVQNPTGGAFGGKEDVPSEIGARAAVAALKLNRPVKLVYRRRDDTRLTSKRHPFEMKYRVGVTNEGGLIAADVELHENAGAYATLSSVVSYRAAMQAMGPYVIPNVRVHSTAWYTNLPPNGAFRGFGSPQATFGHERMMDIVADELGIDPLELRLMNLLEAGKETITGHKLTSSVGVKETVRKAADASRWSERRKRSRRPDRYLRGIGIACCHYGNCLGAAGWSLDGAGAKLQIRRDGSVAVAYGLVEMGQGANTVIAQMTAEALGIRPERVSVLPTDTRNVPDSGPSVASRNVVMTGNAIRDAAAKLMPEVKAAAAEMLDCGPDDIEILEDIVRSGSNGRSVPFEEVAEYLYTGNRPMDMLGWWHVPKLDFDPETGFGEAYFTYSYATHVAQVKIDTLTGRVRVEKIWAAHDIGRAINPAGLEGQVEGGTLQGVGWALTEHFQLDDGEVTTLNFSTYLLPTAMDIPEVETIIIECPEPLGPWGAKGIGEPAIIPTAAAVANAVSDALGLQMNEIPLTPERVLEALTAKHGRPGAVPKAANR